ncbi:hypothetical protein LUZ60_002193 [Juncus effusus]|nr:hypothetical protein LUZ60_002193 [Juncus effusus]
MASKNYSKKFKKHTSESIAPFNRCSQLKSLLSLLRGAHRSSSSNLLTPLNYTQLTPSYEYKNRLRQLEQELDRLKERVVNGGKNEETESGAPAMKKCLFGEDREGEEDQEREESDIVRLRDGCIFHEITKVWIRAGRKMEGLCMHVSPPTVADDAVTASEVLSRMTSLKMADLCKCLMNLMPMADITGLNPMNLTTIQPAQPDSKDFFVDSILFNSLQKLEGLVLEGLNIQMDLTNPPTNYIAPTVRSKNPNDCVVIVALIQVRDSKENLRSIGELMIGIIEAQMENGDEDKFRVEGVTVAGLNCTRKKIEGRDFMWTVSSKRRDGSDGSSSFIRNPDRLFA